MHVDFYHFLKISVSMYMFLFCMYSLHSALTFIVYNNVICTKSFSILFYNGHIDLNYTAHFVYSPLNLYVYIHWILDFKYILLYIYIYM